LVTAAKEPVGVRAAINTVVAVLAIESIEAVAAFDGIIVAASKDLVVAVPALDVEAKDVAAIVFGKTDSRVIFVAGTMFVRGRGPGCQIRHFFVRESAVVGDVPHNCFLLFHVRLCPVAGSRLLVRCAQWVLCSRPGGSVAARGHYREGG
jgi:hypothetical protein